MGLEESPLNQRTRRTLSPVKGAVTLQGRSTDEPKTAETVVNVSAIKRKMEQLKLVPFVASYERTLSSSSLSCLFSLGNIRIKDSQRREERLPFRGGGGGGGGCDDGGRRRWKSNHKQKKREETATANTQRKKGIN